MIDKRPRIIDVERKPQKCPVCGERVVDIIYGTGDMTEIEFLIPSGARPQNSLLGPGPKTKSQGTGLLIKVAIARYAGKNRYNELKGFIEENHRNPSKHRIEEHDFLNG